MAWETRNGGGRYYTRSRRVNGRMIREYIGCGSVAELVAQQDELARAQKARERKALNDKKEELERIEELLSRSWKGAWDLARMDLINAGYYRHHRGKWRRRRNG